MRSMLLALAATGLCAAEFTVTPVLVSTGAALPGDLPFEVKPHGYENGLTVHFLVTGEGLTAIDEESLKITTLTLAGKDVANNRKGGPVAKLGSFPKATDDGKYGAFSVEAEIPVFGRLGQLHLAGTVDVLIGDEITSLVTKPVPADKGGPAETLSGFTITIEPPTSGKKGMFGGEAGLGVTVQGQLNRIAEVVLTVDGKTIKGEGWSGGGDQRTFNYPAVKTGALVVTIKAWKTLTAHPITFRYPQSEPAKK